MYEAIGGACSQLKTFILRHEGYLVDAFGNHSKTGDAIGIASMKQLRHLSLVCIDITNDELMDIIDSCPYLEHLCVSYCYNIAVNDDELRAKCARIKTVKLTHYHDDRFDCRECSEYPNQDTDECCCAEEFQPLESDFSNDSDESWWDEFEASDSD